MAQDQRKNEFWQALATYLAVREGYWLNPVAESRGGPPAVVEPGGSRTRFLPLDVGVESARVGRRAFLRMIPVNRGFAETVALDIAELASAKAPRHGTIRLDRQLADPTRDVPVFPPLYFCKQKGEWIAAAAAKSAADPPRLADLRTGKEADGPAHPLETLWNGVQKTLGQDRTADSQARDKRAAGLPVPLCYDCERRQTCYPGTGSPTQPKGAVEALTPVMPSAWCGVIVEPFDLPLAAWLRLADGGDVARLGLEALLPSVLLREIDERLQGKQICLVPPDLTRRAGGEAMLLRLELLKQLLEGLRDIHAGLGRAHGGLRPQSVWVSIDESGTLGPALWSPRVQILDLARGESETAAFDYPDELTPAERGPRAAISGMLIPRGETADDEGPKGAKFLFLPENDSSVLPEPGELIAVAVIRDGKQVRQYAARIEVAFSDVFRLVLVPDAAHPDEDVSEVARGGDQTVVRVGESEPTADRDLFAAGTVWLGMLRHDCDDLAGAANLRDAMLAYQQEEEIAPTDHGAAERACVHAALKAGGLFRGAFAEDGGGSGSEHQLLGRALWLGLRMCLPLESGSAEPPGPAAVYTHLLREVGALQNEARYRVLGRPARDEEILSVVRAFETKLVGK